MASDRLLFNGIHGATGQPFTPPLALDGLPAILPSLLPSDSLPIPDPFLDISSDLAQAGYGVIFPAQASSEAVAAVRQALGELLALRQAQAGPRYREFSGPEGCLPGETAAEFLTRHSSSPETGQPGEALPFFWLIVADPQVIPFSFQIELGAAGAVGRACFDSLEGYARYARSVAMAESSGRAVLPNQAIFFSASRTGDPLARWARDGLVKPLAQSLSAALPDWKLKTLTGSRAGKKALTGLLGGESTPAFLFAAAHGLTFPYADERQFSLQGALVTGCTPGSAPLPEQSVSAADIPEEAALLGLVAFLQASFSLGSDREDEFATQAFSLRASLAPQAFLAALPQRLLGHPRGGALGVFGFTGRALAFPVRPPDGDGEAAYPAALGPALQRILAGEPLGLALHELNRAAAPLWEEARRLLDSGRKKADELERLALLWAAASDLSRLLLLGDPAARLPVNTPARPVAVQPEQAARELSRELDSAPAGAPSLPARTIAPVGEVLLELPEGERSLEAEAATRGDIIERLALGGLFSGKKQEGAADSGIADNLRQVRENLNKTLKALAERLETFVDQVATLEISTYASPGMDQVQYNPANHGFTGGATRRALTAVRLSGDMSTVIPSSAAELDEALWQIHIAMVDQAQTNRAALIKTAAEALAQLVGNLKGGGS